MANDDGSGGTKKPTKAKLGVKNEFYFDEELKCWRERGAPPPKGVGPLAPPPTSVPGMASSATGSAAAAAAGNSTSE